MEWLVDAIGTWALTAAIILVVVLVVSARVIRGLPLDGKLWLAILNTSALFIPLNLTLIHGPGLLRDLWSYMRGADTMPLAMATVLGWGLLIAIIIIGVLTLQRLASKPALQFLAYLFNGLSLGSVLHILIHVILGDAHILDVVAGGAT